METPVSPAAVLALIQTGLREIGYRDELLRDHYRFADVLAENAPTRTVDLAAFAQEPPSHRSACFGVALLDRVSAPLLQPYRALGAPQLLVVPRGEPAVQRWRMPAKGEPTFIERIEPAQLRAAFQARRGEWSPERILRAKSISFERGPIQLDFFDSGLLPTLEGVAHDKLDRLLRDVLATGKAVYAEHHDREPEYESLFRLIFRFIAAKMLADREFPGEHWSDPDPQQVIAAVDQFYFSQSSGEAVLQNRNVQRAMWDKIRHAFNFQNLSVEALAYVYENTLVSERSRRLLDTHATPPAIAEYVVRQLPFDALPRDQRRVFEPFAGHAPFLIAALGRLRTLLLDTPAAERHAYFVRMLSGMELDAFAREVARYSLILADYPNPDGWDIAQGDVFQSPETDRYLQQAQIVLCNPPFSNFPQTSRDTVATAQSTNRAVAALNRVLQHPPAMLGFLLPRAFVSGQEYREARRRLATRYQQIDTVILPDNVFRHSDVETALVIAHTPSDGANRRSSSQVTKRDLTAFVQTGTPTWRVELPVNTQQDASDPVFWRTPLWRVWESLQHLRRLDTVAEVHRGIEYRVPLRANAAELVAFAPRPGFVPGLLSVTNDFEPYSDAQPLYLNSDPSLMLYEAYKLPWDKPKVVANAARLSRGPWRLAASVDRQGLVCYQRFHGIWPTSNPAHEILAAVLNSPVANAFLATHAAASERDNQIRAINAIPFPAFTRLQEREIVAYVDQYREAREQWREQPERAMELERVCRELLAQLDAAVLAAYDLPPRLEKELLTFFAGHQRPGPVRFTGYYPPNFRPAIPWRVYISEAYRKSSARETLERLPVLNDPVITAFVQDSDDDDDDRDDSD